MCHTCLTGQTGRGGGGEFKIHLWYFLSPLGIQNKDLGVVSQRLQARVKTCLDYFCDIG